MTAHLNEEQLRLYRQRSLPAEGLLRASEHIARCDLCRAQVASGGELHDGVERFRGALEAESTNSTHAEYEEIAAYVDSRLSADAAARVDRHSEECQACATDLHDIRNLKRELEAIPVRQSLWKRAAELWKAAGIWQAPMVVAGAAAGVLILVFLLRQPAHPDLRAKHEPAKINEPAMKLAGVVAIHDGSRVISVGTDGRVSGLDALADRDRADVEHALAAKRIEPPIAIADLTGEQSVLLGTSPDAPRLKLARPLGTVVETQQPLFQWDQLAGAEYLVSVYDRRYEEVASSGWIRRAEWRASSGLPRGSRYSWQLKVRLKGSEFTIPAPPAPEARFKVLSASDEAGLTAARSASGDSYLALGILYAGRGLLDDAEQELHRLREQNPESQTVQALLASVEGFRKGR
jgi:anti-sigma factor RsiW